MKRNSLLFFTVLLVNVLIYSAQAKIKVACVGNSITVGYTNYPTSLAVLLGDNYQVGNFGNWGHSMSDNNPESYMRKQPFIDAQNFNPNIVTIKLGSNDSKAAIWNKDTFEISLRKMITIFQTLPTHPRIILCRPIPAYDNPYGIRNSIIANDIPAILNKVSTELGLTVVDLYTPIFSLADHSGLYQWDNVHINYKGAQILANTLYAGITGKTFTMKDGGVEVPVSIEIPVSGQKLNLGLLNFGSLPSYFKVQVEAQLKTATGSFDFYLDDSIKPFATVNLLNQHLDSVKFEGAFSQKITDSHQVSVVWNGQEAKLNKVIIKEIYAPFVPVVGKKYLIINKYNKLSISSNGSNLWLAKPDGVNKAQQFIFDKFAYGVYLLKNQTANYALSQIGSNANFQDTQEKQSSMRIVSVGGGTYLIGTSDTTRLGKVSAASNVISSVHKDVSIQEWDKWMIVDADSYNLSNLSQKTLTSFTVYSANRMILVSDLFMGDIITLYNAKGLVVLSRIADKSSLSIPVQKGFYLVKVSNSKVSNTQKVYVK